MAAALMAVRTSRSIRAATLVGASLERLLPAAAAGGELIFRRAQPNAYLSNVGAPSLVRHYRGSREDSASRYPSRRPLSPVAILFSSFDRVFCLPS